MTEARRTAQPGLAPIRQRKPNQANQGLKGVLGAMGGTIRGGMTGNWWKNPGNQRISSPTGHFSQGAGGVWGFTREREPPGTLDTEYLNKLMQTDWKNRPIYLRPSPRPGAAPLTGPATRGPMQRPQTEVAQWEKDFPELARRGQPAPSFVEQEVRRKRLRPAPAGYSWQYRDPFRRGLF